MRALPFTIPKAENASFLVQEQKLLKFYPHLHRHKEVQLCMINKGYGTIFIEAEFHDFQEGDIFIIGSNCAHLFKNENDDGAEMVSVFFNPSPKENPLMNLVEMQKISEVFTNMGPFHRIKLDLKVELMDLLSVDSGSQLEKFLRILNKTISQIHTSDYVKPIFSEGINIKVKTVMEYTIKNFHKHIDLEKISSLIHYSPEAFCRFFKKRTGKTYMSYLNECRINEACKRLLHEDKPEVSRIAFECGFNNVSNFNRVFKFNCNCAPLQYRKQYFSKLGKTTLAPSQ